jgi:glycosyltransferase involved in cell wall biosynthesis
MSARGTDMRVLAHIHTFNDADIIDRTVEAVRRQTRPVDAILIVDNASSDGTLEQPSVKHATVLRQSENTGTSGAVYTGLQFAIEQNYDWIWVFDADSTPEPDALEKLLDLYASWPEAQQNETAFLACTHYNVEDGVPQLAGIFGKYGFTRADPNPQARHYPCHVCIWSGCLYRVAAVRQIGLPNADYVLDWGEGEYGYRVMRAGYKGFICLDAVLQHNIRGYMSLNTVKLVKLGPATWKVTEFAPIRCYYYCRNPVYFALYDGTRGRIWLLRGVTTRVMTLVLNFLLQPRDHGAQIRACLRGLWHGLTGNIVARY